MKNKVKNIILVFLIMILVLYLLLKDNYNEIMANILSANKVYLIISVVLVIIYYLLKTLGMYLITKEYKRDFKFKEMFKEVLITQFFNGITPFSTGGQPYQIYMLKKNGIKISNASAITIQDFIMYQLALIIIGFLAIVTNLIFNLIEMNSTIYFLIVLGFAINILVGLILLFISFSKKFNDAVGKLIIKILSKTRLIKNKQEILNKWEVKLEEFNNSSMLFKNNKMLLLKCFLANFFALFIFYLIPYVIFKSQNNTLDLNIVSSVLASASILIIGNFVPIPGASGGIEYAFLIIFGKLVEGSIINSTLIVWRTVTYYLGIILGGILLGFSKGEKKK